MGNRERAAEAEKRVRAAVERLHAEGKRVTLAAIVAAAGCSKTTAAKAVRAVRENDAAPSVRTPQAAPVPEAPLGTGAGQVVPLERTSKRIGRPTSLTPEVFETVCEAVAAGVPLEPAAALAGVSTRSLFNWMERGRAEPGSAFERFMQALEKAQGDAILRNVCVVQRAADKSWQASAWWLERRFPEYFGRREALSVQHQGEVSVTIRYIDEDSEPAEVIDIEPAPTGRRGR